MIPEKASLVLPFPAVIYTSISQELVEVWRVWCSASGAMWKLWLTNEFVGLISGRSRGCLVLYCTFFMPASLGETVHILPFPPYTYMYDWVSAAPNFVKYM